MTFVRAVGWWCTPFFVVLILFSTYGLLALLLTLVLSSFEESRERPLPFAELHVRHRRPPASSLAVAVSL